VEDSKGHTTQSPLLTNNLACQVHPHLFCVTNVGLEDRSKYRTHYSVLVKAELIIVFL
jgi:hypothetical protein